MPGVIVWGTISYYGQSNFLRIEDNLNSNKYVSEVLEPEVVLFLQGIGETIHLQDNIRPHVEKTIRGFCSAEHMQLLWPAYSVVMSPIEHLGDSADRLIPSIQLF